MMRRLFVLCVGLTAATVCRAQVPQYDVYVNDDGTDCAVMVEVTHAPNQPKDAIRRYLYAALRAQPQNLCDPSSKPIVFAIVVPEHDAYGQPKWGTVRYEGEFAVDLKAVRGGSADPSADDLARMLPDHFSK